MKYLHLWLIAGIFMLFSCEKVNDLSDNVGIESFNILSYTPTQASIGNIISEENNIYIEALPEENLFPLSIQAKINVNSQTDDIIGLPDTLEFTTGYSTIDFHLIAESGVAHRYQIALKPIDSGADILLFELNEQESVNSSISINPWNKTILIAKSNINMPITLHPARLVGSLNATVEDVDSITFSSTSDIVKINVTSSNHTTTEWSILLEDNSQLPNAALELWVDQTFGTKVSKNIDPTPGKGKGWATANNNYVQGTLPVVNQGGLAAQMTTAIQSVPILDHDLIAAGSLYTGFFSLNLDFEHPRIMTNFGIPHQLRIKAVRFDAKYNSGPQLMQAVKNENEKYRLVNLPGYDNGQAWIELLHWSGKEELQYHGEPMEGLKVLGRGEHVFYGHEDIWHNWNKVTLTVDYNEEYLSISPTHIVVVFSSSKEGEFFKGSPGSTLIVDNLELIY